MKTYTIPAKGSNTGSIHDIADANVERDIKFRKGCQFAVVMASYYQAHFSNRGYSTYKSSTAAAKASNKLNASNTVIDTEGMQYDVIRNYDGFDLVATGRKA
jgi:hypothetical protein